MANPTGIKIGGRTIPLTPTKASTPALKVGNMYGYLSTTKPNYVTLKTDNHYLINPLKPFTRTIQLRGGGLAGANSYPPIELYNVIGMVHWTFTGKVLTEQIGDATGVHGPYDSPATLSLSLGVNKTEDISLGSTTRVKISSATSTWLDDDITGGRWATYARDHGHQVTKSASFDSAKYGGRLSLVGMFFGETFDETISPIHSGAAYGTITVTGTQL